MRDDWLGSVLIAGMLVIGAAGCEVEQEREGEAPTIDVDVEEGQIPEYRVETPDVEVRADTERVIVPEVEVEDPGS